jgi:glycosyltransferase involved in cell wall biosynthesis
VQRKLFLRVKLRKEISMAPHHSNPLTICLDARIMPSVTGGTEQYIIGVAAGLGRLTDGDEQYVFLTYEDHDWLKPYLGGNARIVPLPTPQTSLNPFQAIRLAGGRWTKRFLHGDQHLTGIPADVVHFLKQDAFLTSKPSLYNPLDLQHRHLPHYFNTRARLTREMLYRLFLRSSSRITVWTQWGKRDLMQQYRLPADKICVIPCASVLELYPQPTGNQIEDVRHRFQLPQTYLFYPSKTYPHKNHLRLMGVLADLRSQGLVVHLVCSGSGTRHQAEIQAEIQRLGLVDQVYWVGYVTPTELVVLYQLAHGLVFPSLFEGWGLPTVEALSYGVPIAASNATTIPEIVGAAAALFDPNSETEMASAIQSLYNDSRRSTMIALGRKRAEHFSWERSARELRAHYRQLAGQALNEEDQHAIAKTFTAIA